MIAMVSHMTLTSFAPACTWSNKHAEQYRTWQLHQFCVRSHVTQFPIRVWERKIAAMHGPANSGFTKPSEIAVSSKIIEASPDSARILCASNLISWSSD